MKVTFFTVPKCVANLGKGCRQFSRCPHRWLSLIMLFLITCAFKLISSAAFWPSILKRFSLLIGVPQAWEDILIFTSVILLSQSSAACENTLSFIRIYTQILLFDYLIPACPPLKKKKKTNNPEIKTANLVLQDPAPGEVPLWSISGLEGISWVPGLVCVGCRTLPTLMPWAWGQQWRRCSATALPRAPHGASWRNLGLWSVIILLAVV